MMTDLFSEVTEPAQALESELGLPQGFLDRLQQEDDWSFVIKMHALVEAAATHTLVAHTGMESAREFFSRLELSGTNTGKVTLADALGLLQPEERRFIRYLSEIRNVLVHDVRNVEISLAEYFGRISKDKRKQYAKAFCYVDFDAPNDEVSDSRAIEMLGQNPKLAIWNSGLVIVAIFQLQADTANLERKAERYRAQALSSWHKSAGKG